MSAQSLRIVFGLVGLGIGTATSLQPDFFQAPRSGGSSRSTGHQTSGMRSGMSGSSKRSGALKLLGLDDGPQTVSVPVTHKGMDRGVCTTLGGWREITITPSDDAIVSLTTLGSEYTGNSDGAAAPLDQGRTLTLVQNRIREFSIRSIKRGSEDVRIDADYGTRLRSLQQDAAACEMGFLDHVFAESFAMCRVPQARPSVPPTPVDLDLSIPLVDLLPTAGPIADHPLFQLKACTDQHAALIDDDAFRFRKDAPSLIRDISRLGAFSDLYGETTDPMAQKTRVLEVRAVCGQVLSVFVYKTVPWSFYIQGMHSWCRHLFGMLGLPEADAWRGMMYLGDAVTRKTRAMAHRAEEASAFFVHFFNPFLKKWFPVAASMMHVAAEMGISETHTYYSLYETHILTLSVPETDSVSLALKRELLTFVLLHGRPALIALFIGHLEQQAARLAAEPHLADAIARSVTLGVATYPPETAEAGYAAALTRARAILTTSYSAPSKFAVKFLQSKYSFAALVEMLDVLVDDGLGQTDYDWIAAPPASAELVGRLAERLFALPPATQVSSYLFDLKVDQCVVTETLRSVAMLPTADAVAQALERIGEAPAPAPVGPGTVVVEGTQRVIPDVAFAEHKAALLAEGDACLAGKLAYTFVRESSTECEVIASPRSVADAVRKNPDWSLTPLIECLGAVRAGAHQAAQGHLYALLEIRNAVAFLPEPVQMACEEILAVYAVRIVNEAFGFVPAMPGWCAYLRGTAGMTEDATLAVLIRMGNEISGQTRFGHRRTAEYGSTLASFWIQAMRQFWALDRYIAAMEALLQPAFVVDGVARLLQEGLVPDHTEEYADADRGVIWNYLLEHGRPGMFALLVAALQFQTAPFTDAPLGEAALRRIQKAFIAPLAGSPGLTQIEFFTQMTAAATQIRTAPVLTASGPIAFEQFVRIIDSLVDGTMAHNQYLMGIQA